MTLRAVPLQAAPRGAARELARVTAQSEAVTGAGNGVSCVLSHGVLRSKHSRGGFQVPLLLAEVADAPLPRDTERKKASPLTLIAVVQHPESGPANGNKQHEPSQGWLVVCRSSEAPRFLETVSAYGGIRYDLRTQFESDAANSLGKGSYAKVLKARDRYNGDTVAIKWMNADTTAVALSNEAKMLALAQSHDSVIGFRGIFASMERDTDNVRWALVFDCHVSGDLFDHIQIRPLLSDEAKQLFNDMMAGLAHIHEKGIVHRDMKPENVLVTTNGGACLTDFGLAAMGSDADEMARKCGSLGYIAPETLSGAPVCCKSDNFGAGIVLFFMLTAATPFYSDRPQRIVQKTLECKLDLERPLIGSASEPCKEIIRNLVCLDVSKRLTAHQSLRHPFLRGQQVLPAPRLIPSRLPT